MRAHPKRPYRQLLIPPLLAIAIAIAACGGTGGTATPSAKTVAPHNQTGSTVSIDEASSGNNDAVQPTSNSSADAPVSSEPDNAVGRGSAADSAAAIIRAPAPAEQRGGITVSGEGTVTARPDTAFVTLGFSAQHSSVAAAQREAAQKMSAVVEKLRALGIAARDIQTTNYSIYREQERGLFVVGNDVRVVVRDVGASSGLLDGAVAAGANTVRGISFSVEDRAALERRAREGAVRDARARAGELARLARVTLGGPTAISEVAPPGPVAYGEAMARDSAAGSQTPIEPGELTIRMSLQVTYAIEP